MAQANALNIGSAGLVKFDGTATFSGVTTTANQIQIGAASNGLSGVAVGSTGQVLQGNTAAAPTFSTATFPSTATGTGKVLIADGTNWVASTPTFPNASATSGKFIRSDGTNWIASTPTLPTSAGTSGKVLQSDGTNYVESTPTYPSASGSAGKLLRSDGTNNVYTTSTYPDTNAVSTLLYASSANVMAALATANTAIVATNSSGVPSVTTTPACTSITLSGGTALSNYVEGTWTPVLTFGGGTTGITYSTQRGQYIRIGNIVHYSYRLVLTSKGSSTGAATMTGLVVTSGATSIDTLGQITASALTMTANYQIPYTNVAASSTTVNLFQFGSNQTINALSDTNFANTTTLIGSGWYFSV